MEYTKVLKKLFSVKNSANKKHKIIPFLGIKFKVPFRYKDKKVRKLFSKIRKNSVLIVEANWCHFEVVPGYVKYFRELGYNVDLIIHQKSVCDLFQEIFPDVQIYNFDLDRMREVFASTRIKKYEYLFFTSAVKYVEGIHANSPDSPLVSDFFPKIAMDKNRRIYVQHHMERNCENKNQIALADLHNPCSEKFYIVNPHYFGNVAITPKSDDVTRFIVVGAMFAWRKNYDLLIEAVRTLSKKTDRFKVILVGGGNPPEIDEDIAGFFDIRGRLSYPDMFRAMEEADFFLCLLDPDNADHERYIQTGTSGSFQLIYGFAKPCLLHKYFADVYEFNNENALVYEKNNELASFMAKAVNMSAAEYRLLQQGVEEKAAAVRKMSLTNLQNLLQQSRK